MHSRQNEDLFSNQSSVFDTSLTNTPRKSVIPNADRERRVDDTIRGALLNKSYHG